VSVTIALASGANFTSLLYQKQ